MEETADSSGLKPLGMTKKGAATAHLKVRPFKTSVNLTFSAASEGVLHQHCYRHFS
jgi:hypothetical protein